MEARIRLWVLEFHIRVRSLDRWLGKNLGSVDDGLRRCKEATARVVCMAFSHIALIMERRLPSRRFFFASSVDPFISFHTSRQLRGAQKNPWSILNWGPDRPHLLVTASTLLVAIG